MENTEQTDEQAQPTGRTGFLRKLLKLLVYLVIFIIAMQLGQLWLQRDMQLGPAPPISELDSTGQPVSLQDYRGKPMLLYFWATWCPICRLEHGAISSLAEDHAVLSVALQSGSVDEIHAHMQEHEASYRFINDPDGVLASRYGIRGVPTSILIDADGNMRTILSGYTTGLSLRLRMWQLMLDNETAE